MTKWTEPGADEAGRYWGSWTQPGHQTSEVRLSSDQISMCKSTIQTKTDQSFTCIPEEREVRKTGGLDGSPESTPESIGAPCAPSGVCHPPQVEPHAPRDPHAHGLPVSRTVRNKPASLPVTQTEHDTEPTELADL